MDILILLADLALTVFVYCSPAAVYRFLIKKEPAEKIPARNFCIISSVIVYLVLLVIYLSAGFDIVPNVTAAALWGFASYHILLYADKGQAKENNDSTNKAEEDPVQLSIFDTPEIQTSNDESPQEQVQESKNMLAPEPSPAPDEVHGIPPAKEKINTDTLIVVCVVVLLCVFALAIVVYAIATAA